MVTLTSIKNLDITRQTQTHLLLPILRNLPNLALMNPYSLAKIGPPPKSHILLEKLLFFINTEHKIMVSFI